MKKCSKCGIVKQSDRFSKNKQQKDGLNPQCKDCVNQYHYTIRDRLKENKKRWDEQNREYELNYKREYRRDNFYKIMTDHAKNTAKKYGVYTDYDCTDLKQKFDDEFDDKDNMRCSICGKRMCMPCTGAERNDIVTLDHIKPFSAGGTNTLDNIQFVCHLCNVKKGCKYEEEVIDNADEG